MSKAPTQRADNAHRIAPTSPIYRAIMAECEKRREELGWSMSVTDDKSGLNDGHYSKIIYPDTPSGRIGNWLTIELAVCALFGRGWTLQIVPDDTAVPSALGIARDASAKSREIRHWRHSRHFRELGAKGGRERASHPKFKQMQSAAAKARWKRWRHQQRLARRLAREGERISDALAQSAAHDVGAGGKQIHRKATSTAGCR